MTLHVISNCFFFRPFLILILDKGQDIFKRKCFKEQNMWHCNVVILQDMTPYYDTVRCMYLHKATLFL